VANWVQCGSGEGGAYGLRPTGPDISGPCFEKIVVTKGPKKRGLREGQKCELPHGGGRKKTGWRTGCCGKGDWY